jgi:hypothetical protein
MHAQAQESTRKKRPEGRSFLVPDPSDGGGLRLAGVPEAKGPPHPISLDTR